MTTQVEIRLLGEFAVELDGVPVAASAWPRRQAASLVKILALAPGRRLHRERLIDLLWPELSVAEAAPRLHKLAHYARRAFGDVRDAVVLRDDMVSLFPGLSVVIDVDVFERAAEAALIDPAPDAASAAADLYGGPLLPDDLYEPWAGEPRERIRLRYLDVLRHAEQWERLVTAEPADEEAHLALMRRHLDAGDHRAALRQFERMNAALKHELGVGPGPRALALRDQIVAALPQPPGGGRPALVGRDDESTAIEGALADASHGRGRTVLVLGPAGVGKSALLDQACAWAERAGWRTGRGVAAAIEGAWPYAPVMEALADLCRRHPTLLDGLDDTYRAEIERALAGHELTWSGEGTHQRLFVATAQLVRIAAAGSGLLLTVDDVHEADEASLRLLHYLARTVAGERAVVVLGFRDGGARIEQIRSSLVRRNLAVQLRLHPLGRAGTQELVKQRLPTAPPETVDRIWAVSGGLPFTITEMARAPEPADAAELGALALTTLAPATREALQRVAVLGASFDTDQFVALTGLPEPRAFAALDAALAALVIQHTGAGYRFRHALIRDALLAGVAPAQQRAFHHQAARRLHAIGAPPARVAHHLIAAGELAAAVPHVLLAVETEAAIGAYRDALTLVDAVRGNATATDRARLLALRANLLAALGDRATIDAYREALAVAAEADRPLLRARMGQAAVMEGDLETATWVLEGLEPSGDEADVPILLAKGSLAFFSGDVDGAWKAADQVNAVMLPDEVTWQRLDLLTLQALIAHQRGELFSRLRTELTRARDTPALASTLFDPYLCVTEFLLYGTTPYGEVKALAQSLRDTARRMGILRGEAFATTLLGEAALLAGEFVVAERELLDAVDLHREIGASAGEANTLQRLAELRLYQGRKDEARHFLVRALPRARWSVLALHLVQRILGTMIRAAPDPHAARAMVDQARETMGPEDACAFCVIMFAVPAATACADVGDLDDAREYLAIAERSSELWEGTAWQAAILESRAHMAAAAAEYDRSVALLGDAAALFEQAGQPVDAARCTAGVTAVAPRRREGSRS
ncbi:ATP-binding protein [Phytoactinopolyspora halotolerans]|uniref:ATP-binding protein n=1 Tax=Phytoactinopolyspora halotolerans TaxID=1981512 RepID=UPI001C2068BB|nr:AAA family ATPase [Phytoactinopolyspora halotolerans]